HNRRNLKRRRKLDRVNFERDCHQNRGLGLLRRRELDRCTLEIRYKLRSLNHKRRRTDCGWFLLSRWSHPNITKGSSGWLNLCNLESDFRIHPWLRPLAGSQTHSHDLGRRSHLQGTYLEGWRQLHRSNLEGESELDGGVHAASRSGCVLRGWSFDRWSGWDCGRFKVFRHGWSCGYLRCYGLVGSGTWKMMGWGIVDRFNYGRIHRGHRHLVRNRLLLSDRFCLWGYYCLYSWRRRRLSDHRTGTWPLLWRWHLRNRFF